MRFCVILLAVSVGIGFAGCRKRSVQPPDPPPKIEQSEKNVATTIPMKPEPTPILDRMINAYQSTFFYKDKAMVQILGKMSLPNTEPIPWDCSIVFQKPNQIRLAISEGIYVSDGKDCYAQIRSLPDQILHHPAPDSLTLETLFQDVYLDHAMSLGLPPSVLRFPPQLILLLANDPLNTFCPKGSKVEWLEQQPIGQIPCDVIRVSHSDGNRLLWISQENSALLRLDYQPVGLPVPEGFDSIEAIRMEMTGAQFNGVVSGDTFQPPPLSPSAAEVAKFNVDIPGLSTPEEHRQRLKLMAESDTFRLIDQQIESTISAEQAPPKTAPKTFTLSPLWKQPLVGGSAIALQPGKVPKILIPCEGNLVAVMNLEGKVLQKNSPKGLENSIITNIQVSPVSTGKQQIGILTLDGKFSLFDESFTPLSVPHTAFQADGTEEIRDFQFIPYNDSVLIVLGIQKKQETAENAIPSGVIRAVERLGNKRWESAFEGMVNQVSYASSPHPNPPPEGEGTLFNSPLGGEGRKESVLVSGSAVEQDSILTLTADGAKLDSVEIPFGRRVLWFQLFDSTIYTLLEDPNTGDVRFAGLNRHGKGLWSRLLPSGEYEIEPIFVPKVQKWFVPLQNGEIMVFDLQGNADDTFSLNIVPTGLFCEEIEGNTVLIITDGAVVSAWKLE